MMMRAAKARAARSARRDARHEGPRERLVALGTGALSDAELVALILRTGAAEADVLAVAHLLLRRFSGLEGLASAELAELCAAAGVGPAKAASLAAAAELGRRLAASRLRPGDPIRGPADVHRHFQPWLPAARQERFVLLLLDGRHRVQREVVISQGTLTASLVHPREVFRPALREAAAAVVLVHNHPSGDPTPSPEDVAVTRRIAEAGELLGVPVLDHVVVAHEGYVSLRDRGLMETAARGRQEPTGAGEVACSSASKAWGGGEPAGTALGA